MKDNEFNNEIGTEQLDSVTGGTSPRYPADLGVSHKFRSAAILNTISGKVAKQDGVKFDRPFEVCPKCGSASVSFNSTENICMCQDCGYCEDRSK